MSRGKSLKFVLVLVVLLCSRQAAQSFAASAPKSLHYAFAAGQSYVYDVKIQIDLPTEQETLAGLSTYKVTAVDATTGQITMSHSADLARSTHATQQAGLGGPPHMMRPPRPFSFTSYNTPCEIAITPNGKIARYEHKSQLPFLLGDAWALALVPLPTADQKTWQTSRELELTEQQANGFFPRPMDKSTGHPCTETVDYSINDPAVASPVITRKYVMESTEQSDGEPMTSQKGEGAIAFDSAAGMIQSVDEKYVLRVNQKGVSVKIPITVSAKLMTAAEAAKKLADRKTAADHAKQAIADSQKLKPIDDAALTALLADVKSPSQIRYQPGFQKLAAAEPIENRRDEVAAVLLKVLDEHDHWKTTGAEKALIVWGNDSCTAPLIKLLDDHDVFTRDGAMEALGSRKTEAAAEAVAKFLPEFGESQNAGQSLKAMGPVAEKSVLPFLKDREWTVRILACEILGEVGTKQSVEPLKAASGDENRIVQKKATEAMKQIEARGT